MEENQCEIARIVQRNHHIRQMIDDQVKTFLTLKSELVGKLENEQIHDNPIIENSGRLFESVDMKSLNEQVASTRIPLALVGTNSCGKTSFLHFLLQSGTFLPIGVGAVTARIIRLTYADAADAALYVYSSFIDQQIDEEVSLAKYFINRSEGDWDGVRRTIEGYVTRPDAKNIPTDSDEFARWAKCFVEIRLPSAFLRYGIDIYDTPGLLFSDAAVLKSNLCEVVKLVKPSLVFMYENASICSETRDCFLAVKHAIGPLADVRMFFLNTKADIERIIADADPNNVGVEDEKVREIVYEARQRRYELLLNVSSIVSEFPRGLPPSIIDCSCFDIVSVHSDLDELGAEMNERSVNRLIDFAATADLRTSRKMSEFILAMIDDFFDLLSTANHRSPPLLRNLFSEALQWTDQYYERHRHLMEDLLSELYTNILQQLDEEKDRMAERAARYESSSAIEDYLKVTFQQEIIKVQMKKVREKYAKSSFLDQRTDVSLLNIAQKNEFLIGAQRNSNWLFESGMKHLDKRSTREIFAEQTILAQILLISDVLIESNDKDKQTGSLSNYKQLFSRKRSLGKEMNALELAKERVREISVWLVNEKAYLNQIIDSGHVVEKKTLMKKISHFYHQAEKSRGEREKFSQLLEKYKYTFASIQCKIISLLNAAESNGKVPLVDSIREIEKDLYVDQNGLMMMKKTSDYLEVHCYLRMIQLRIPNLFPLLNVYEDEKDHCLWMFFPNNFRKLDETKLNIVHVFEISFDLAESLSHLHFHEIVHGDVRIENVFLDENNQCYLANLHFDGKRRLTMSDDINAFGQMGKSLRQRIQSSDVDRSEEEEEEEDVVHLDQLDDLFTRCLHLDMRKRPTAADVVEKIREIRGDL